MLLFSLPLSRPRSVFRLAALGAFVATATASQLALAQGTHLWTQSRQEEFEKGAPQGVALTSDGHLLQGPGLTEQLTTPSTCVWSVAVDKSGTAFLGTASPATVLRIAQNGKPFTLFETKDLAVQVVRIGPDGALYAATIPSGKVYKLNPEATAKQDESSATVIFDAARLDATAGQDAAAKAEAKSHYIWDLTFDAAGRLYIATGGPAAIYRIDVTKKDAAAGGFFQERRGAHPLARLGR